MMAAKRTRATAGQLQTWLENRRQLREEIADLVIYYLSIGENWLKIVDKVREYREHEEQKP